MDKEIERQKTRERVRRYRQRKAENATVTPVTATVTATNVTKMICKCTYYKETNGTLVCIQCGKQAPTGPKDKARRGIELK